MGWPFLWPKDEPWPVCQLREPELAAQYEAMRERMTPEALDRRVGSMPTERESIEELILKCRDGHNEPFLPVLQLSRSHFPELPWPDGADLLQLLWCPMIHFGGPSGHLILWRNHGAVEAAALRTEPPPQSIKYPNVTPCTLDPERIDDYPYHAEMDDDQLNEVPAREHSDEWYQLVRDFGPAPGTKLFGSADWEQCPDYPDCPRCARRMELLLTISSSESGHARREEEHRWLPLEDREAFANDCFRIDTPHDLAIGDNGSAYLFYCPACPGELTSVVQCG